MFALEDVQSVLFVMREYVDAMNIMKKDMATVGTELGILLEGIGVTDYRLLLKLLLFALIIAHARISI